MTTARQEHRLSAEIAVQLRRLKDLVQELNHQRSLDGAVLLRLETVARQLELLSSKEDRTLWQQLTDCLKSFRTVTGAMRVVGSLGGIALAVVGLAASLYGLLPRVSLSSSDPLDRNDPFHVLMTVSNDGVEAIHDVTLTCAVGEVIGTAGEPIPDWTTEPFDAGSRLVKKSVFVTRIIRPGQKATSDRFCPLSGPWRYADVGLVVSYRVFLLGEQERVFRLISVIKPDGSWVWMQQPY